MCHIHCQMRLMACWEYLYMEVNVPTKKSILSYYRSIESFAGNLQQFFKALQSNSDQRSIFS